MLESFACTYNCITLIINYFSRQAEFAYLFGPVGVLLLCNGLLFCLTAQELLCGVWRLDNSDSINFRRKSMGIVVAKLGIVMGMGWILDVLSWAVGNQSPYMFYAADLFNSFQVFENLQNDHTRKGQKYLTLLVYDCRES